MSKYKVGDKLRIRKWDDMVVRFGLNSKGNKDYRYAFAVSMKPMCGKDFTISKIEDGDFYSVEGVECFSSAIFNSGFRYSIPEDVLEPRTEESLMCLQITN